MIKRKTIIKFCALVLALLLAIASVCSLPHIVAFAAEEGGDSGASANPFINANKVEVAAHRSGKNIAPENTMAAFERAAAANRSGEFRVDIFEFDLRMTKDNQLILLHDDTLNRTTNIEDVYPGKRKYYPIDYTYEELRVLNAAVDYEDENGEHPYAKDSGDAVPENHKIPLFQEVAAFLKKEREETGYPYRFIIEIKDGGDLGKKAVDLFYEILQEYDFLDSTVVGTFHNEISDYLTEKEGLMRSAGVREVAEFLVSYLKGEDLTSANLPYVALQIPMRVWLVQLPWVHSEDFIAYAHANGIAVQYWTINDEKDMQKLAAYGADAIITDSPDVLSDILDSEEWTIYDDYSLYIFLGAVVIVLLLIIIAIVLIVRAAKKAKRKKGKHVVA